MWKYEKKLQYPVNIKNKDLNMAKCILTQYGGPAGDVFDTIRHTNIIILNYLNYRKIFKHDVNNGKIEETNFYLVY